MAYTPEELERMKNNLSISDDEVDKEYSQTRLKTKDDTIRELEKQLGHIKIKHQGELNEKEAKIVDLETELTSKEDRIDALEDDLHTAVDAGRRKYERSLAKKDKEIIQLSEELKKVEIAYHEQLKDNSEKMAEIIGELELAKNKLETYKERL
jgi:hypothetical protein